MTFPVGSGLRLLARARSAGAATTATPTGSRAPDRDSGPVAIPRLTMSRPRATSLTPAGRVVMTVALLLFVGAAAAGPLLFGESRRQTLAREDFVQNSVVTSGEVVRLRRNGDSNRRVTYRFVADGRAYEGTAGVSSGRFRALRVGQPISVRYLPDNPARHRLDGAQGDGLPLAIAFVVPVMLGFGGGALMWTLNRQRWLLTEGRAAPGVVTAQKSQKSSHGTKSFAISYEFPLLDGRRATGKSTLYKNPPAIGATVQVLYDPERPGRSAIYPLGYVRAGE